MTIPSGVLDKKRKYTELELAFLEALGGPALGDFPKAKRLAGYSEKTTITSITNGLKDEIIDLANNILVLNAPKASFGIVGMLDSPDSLGARNKLNAAVAILDRVGIVKKEQVEHTVSGASIYILPAKEV